MTPDNPNKPKPGAPYTGPAKPIPTHVELISDRAERIIFLLLAVFFAVLLLLGVV